MKINKEIKITARDGISLITDVYLPEGAGSFPVILIRTPYDRTGVRMQRKGYIYGLQGFVVVIQDVRDTGASLSGNKFYPWEKDTEDGLDTIKWLEKQDFCNGNIATHGGSYLGINQWLLAAQAPESLKCMCMFGSPYSLFHGFNDGGVPYLSLTLLYALYMSGVAEKEGGSSNCHERLWHLPVCDADLYEREHDAWFQDTLQNPTYNDYWKKYDALINPENIKVPILNMDGWYDAYPKQTLQAWNCLRENGGSVNSRTKSKVLLGAWGHDRSPGSWFKDVDFGANNCIDLYAYELRWFKYWLKGEDTRIIDEPPLRLFTSGENTWEDFSTWPPNDTVQKKLYIHSNGKANTVSGDGMLSWTIPESEPSDTFTYDPIQPVPTTGGNHSCAFAGIEEGPTDQREVERREDVLVYSSETLKSCVRITGPVILKLYASSTACDTDFTAKLVDVYTDGRAINLSEGIVRARFRESIYEESLIEPEKVYEYEIRMVDISHVFKAGHKLRLEISSSNFPKYARNLNTGKDNNTSADYEKANQCVFHNSKAPSALIMWVRDL